jgi:hypothetical protein
MIVHALVIFGPALAAAVSFIGSFRAVAHLEGEQMRSPIVFIVSGRPEPQ